MSYEKKLLTQIVDSIYSSDFSDNIVVARLNYSLDLILRELGQSYCKTKLSSTQLTDYIDNVKYAASLITVLEAFSVEDYYELRLKLNLYEEKLKGMLT